MKTFVFLFCAIFPLVLSRANDKYDLSRLPHDLLPVGFLVGRWKLDRVSGRADYIKPPNILDLGINPTPVFGARALNITGHYLNQYDDRVEGTMYGFMPVKNATRFDPRVHTALITTYSNGINMIEQGLVRAGHLVTFHLKQFMRRRFGITGIEGYVVDELERKIKVAGNYMDVTVQTLLTHENGGTVNDDYTAQYTKIIYYD